MRSYHSHLQTTLAPKVSVPPKPVLRASAIFPVFHWPGVKARLLFLGYWILKRHITELAAVLTLRSSDGTALARKNFSITDAKTYRFEVEDLLELGGLGLKEPFIGSLEVEFFSTKNLFFPYPAVVINYYGPLFSTVVHTAQRTFNDYEDHLRNMASDVPESGFNIYADKDREPFISLINGFEATENTSLDLLFYNSEGETLSHTAQLGSLAPFETRIVYPAQECDLRSFLKGKVGSAKATFSLNWIFPRLLVGNIQHENPALMITHTYYDCQEATKESDYWRPTESKWYPASLIIPIKCDAENLTNAYFYPIYSPSNFTIDVEIYSATGECLGKEENVLTIQSPARSFDVIAFKPLCEALAIDLNQPLGARILAKTPAGEKIPSRIKLALDRGAKGDQMPCNICMNLQPFYPPYETKPSTFRWGPLLADQPKSSIWVMNSSPEVAFTQEATVQFTLFREQDTKTLKRNYTLTPHGFIVIEPGEDDAIQAFLNGSIGWFTAVISNPYATTYYFAENPSGIVGGDHGF